MFPYVMFIFEPGYSIPRLCCFFLVSLWLSSLLICPMFILQEILIPLIPKIRSMSEGTIWLSGDWTVNSSDPTYALSPIFLAIFWSPLPLNSNFLFYFSGRASTNIDNIDFLHLISATSLSSWILRLSLARKLRNKSELRIRRQRRPV